MVIFHSYVKLPEGNHPEKKTILLKPKDSGVSSLSETSINIIILINNHSFDSAPRPIPWTLRDPRARSRMDSNDWWVQVANHRIIEWLNNGWTILSSYQYGSKLVPLRSVRSWRPGTCVCVCLGEVQSLCYACHNSAFCIVKTCECGQPNTSNKPSH